MNFEFIDNIMDQNNVERVLLVPYKIIGSVLISKFIEQNLIRVHEVKFQMLSFYGGAKTKWT